MKPTRYFAVAAAVLLPFTTAACSSCASGKDKDPPMPSATPVVTATASATATAATVLTPEPVDAGADVADASDGDAAHPKPGAPTSLARCCAAIEQNQNKAPPEQVPLYAGFIALCKSGIVPPQFRSMAPCK
jgi:hypothetical protein